MMFLAVALLLVSMPAAHAQVENAQPAPEQTPESTHEPAQEPAQPAQDPAQEPMLEPQDPAQGWAPEWTPDWEPEQSEQQAPEQEPTQEPAGEAPTPTPTPTPPPPPLGPPREHDRHIYTTMDMRFSRAPDHTIMFEAGMNVGKAIQRHVALSIELSGSSAPLLGGNRGAFSVLPSAEAFYFHGPVQAYGRLGMGVQYRDGARLDSTKALGLFAAVGSRVRFGRCRGNGPHRCGWTGCFVAGLEIRLHHATSNGWLMHPAVLPQGASILSTGFSMGYEI